MRLFKRVTIDFGPNALVTVDVRQYDNGQDFQVRINDVIIDSLPTQKDAEELFHSVVTGLTK